MNGLLTVLPAVAIAAALLLTFAPAISLALVRSRGRTLPRSLAVRLTEEWAGELDAIPDRAAKLAFALGIRLTRRKSFASLSEDAMTPDMNRQPSRFSTFFGAFGGWKTVIAVPTILLAAVAFGASYLVKPLYRSNTLILVVPQRIPTDYVQSTVNTRIEDRLQAISQQILSRTRLERVIHDFDLYSEERRSGNMEDIVQGMRDDIEVQVEQGAAFRVSYVGRNPRTVMKVTERLSALFIEESLRDREVLAEGTNQFLEAQMEDVRRRLIESGDELHQLEARRNASAGTLDVLKLEYGLMADQYKDLFMKKERAIVASNLERRQIGEQFKLLDPARLPERPFTPNRLSMMLMGGGAGFLLGLVMILSGWGRGRGRPQPQVVAG
jgi:uncharacterized protein involved in exopolysaccharide biosynthesis